MNLHALKTFIIVAKHKSITLAANELLISQPAVTIQIRNLEKELNLKLIEGRGRGIQLTLAGEFIYEQGQRLFRLEQNIENKISDFKERNIQLNISSSYIPINYVLPPLLAQYKLLHPHIFINVALGNVANVEKQVLNYESDIGFVVRSNAGHEDLLFDELMTIPFWFIVHPDHHLANKMIKLGDLSSEQIIFRERGSSTRDLLEAIFYSNNCSLPPIGIQLQGLHESIKAVEAGYGATLAPSFSVSNEIKDKKIARVWVEGIEIIQSLYICTRKMEVKTEPFITFIKEKLNENRKVL
ncbi:LysR family transcriptional regulator [Schinkia azotoformans]|uniref:LysR family transcriptional regulator n=1 Tax=Schinkia azotoformans TaxID=1454 RepID=UPI002E1D7C8B|nr:LysR family transcriptional regulator [Schinkia azotoformans]